jgi:predicted dehydrogenase
VLEEFRSLEVSQGGRRERSSPLFQDKGHANEAEAFVMAVQSGGAPPIPYEELAATTRATFAAVASLASGGPVDLSG